MYLKKIEAQGFKSFANKMVLEFRQGIMGIVGPNGSGKSNVADAVRWVLGEQSAKSLRGSNMQDVIFSGTENRKPQGYAYVALTIDNSDHMLAIDYDEVTISRRVYRSGESEYLMNGSACRLRDIYELFYDTGVGKEGYSIIGQGQIDKILSGKPEDRRELFDEAAGIVKFKKRRQVAQKKLESEENNLVRVSDILNELEKQVGPLEKQSEKARQYLKLKEELTAYEIGAYFLEADDLQKRLAAVRDNHRIVSEDLSRRRQEADALKTRYEELTSELETLEASMAGHRTLLEEARLEKESLEGQVRVLNEQIHTARMNEEHIRQRLASIDQDMERYTRERDEFAAKKGELNRRLDQADDVLDRLEARLAATEEEADAHEREIEHQKSRIIEGLNAKAELGANRQKYETQLEQARLRRSEIEKYLVTARTEEEAQRAQLEGFRTELAAVQRDLEEKRKQQEEAAAREKEADAQIRRHRQRLNNCQQDYHTLKTRLESLVNITERYEGYGGSIRRVMEKKKENSGIRGVVADLLHVEKRYETAMETALGGRIQNIVTDTEATAKQLIEYLKKNRLGRATFLPLSGVNGRESFPRPEALKEEGALGVASELVSVEPEYAAIARHLLGRILVADTIDHALAIARKYRHSLSIVTLEGEYLNPGGAMTGGAFKNNSNLLGRRREMEELEAAIKEALTAYDQAKDQLALAEKEIAQARQTFEELQKQIHEASLAETTLSLQIVRAEDQLGGILENCRRRQSEREEIATRIRELEEQKNQLGGAVQELEQQGQETEKEITKRTRQLERLRAKREQQAEELAGKRLDFQSLSQQDEFLLENILRLGEELDKRNREKQELLDGQAQGEDAVEKKQEEIRLTLTRIQEAVLTAEKLSAILDEEGSRRESGAAEQKRFFEAREEAAARIADLDKESYRLQSQEERLEENLEKQVEYLWTEYELTPTEAEEKRNPAFTSLTETRREIARRKTAIHELGPVNVNAIEDYKEVNQRYIFLRDQHSDLVEARDRLQEVIRELDTGMRRQFEEKFAAIRREFDRVFQELFGGGKGTLELIREDGRDILEAGIAIIAQPPGKKLQNMMQLSGGEKALSAIALLFAIQNLKPSPFCLLDEIEAALDEPNVARYAEYLNKLKEHTQFIVITHRRGTMEMADCLYGITMQEKGVSALVAVDLTDPSLVG